MTWIQIECEILIVVSQLDCSVIQFWLNHILIKPVGIFICNGIDSFKYLIYRLVVVWVKALVDSIQFQHGYEPLLKIEPRGQLSLECPINSLLWNILYSKSTDTESNSNIFAYIIAENIKEPLKISIPKNWYSFLAFL